VSDNRWLGETGGERGPAYAERFRELAASGMDIHGEAALVAHIASPGARVLDAGCGTGRVAIELDRRGYDVVGTDLDPSMLAEARRAAPHIDWHEADVATLALPGRPFDVAVLAGNVMIFVAPGTEAAVLQRVAQHVVPGGLVVAGFQLRLDLETYDRHASAAGLELVERWSTWDRAPYAGGDYAVSMHAKR
jgi:2-polyprenyl-3-methyl-5-hydroxy-6-metoxy-1,4-benzoquinol methylase